MTEDSRAEKFLELFNKGKEFTEELLRENQRLRYRIASLETDQATASTDEVQRLRAEVQQLTDENRRIAQRFPNDAFAYAIDHYRHPQGRINHVKGSLARTQPQALYLLRLDRPADGFWVTPSAVAFCHR